MQVPQWQNDFKKQQLIFFRQQKVHVQLRWYPVLKLEAQIKLLTSLLCHLALGLALCAGCGASFGSRPDKGH